MSPELRRTYAPPCKTDWSSITITPAQATQLLIAARWPNGRPSGDPDPIEGLWLSRDKVSMSELVSGIVTAHACRLTPLPKKCRRHIKNELRKMLNGKHLRDEAFLELWEHLGIR